MNLFSLAKSSSLQCLAFVTIAVILCCSTQAKPLEEFPAIAGKQEKRFYSWEEGKRSAPFADRQHRLLFEDPWRRSIMENVNTDDQEEEGTLYCMLKEQFKSILTTEIQMKETIEEKENFKRKAQKLEQISIRSESLMDSTSRVIDSADYIEDELDKCLEKLDAFTTANQQVDPINQECGSSREQEVQKMEKLIEKLRLEINAKQMVLHHLTKSSELILRSKEDHTD